MATGGAKKSIQTRHQRVQSAKVIPSKLHPKRNEPKMSVGYVAGTDRFQPFGMKHYHAPVIDETWYKVKKIPNYDQMPDKKNNRTFTDLISKRLSHVPGPSRYF